MFKLIGKHFNIFCLSQSILIVFSIPVIIWNAEYRSPIRRFVNNWFLSRRAYNFPGRSTQDYSLEQADDYKHLSSMDDLETMLTLKFSLQKEPNCYSSLSTQVRSWIRSLFLHSIHACLLERKFNYVHISLFQAGIGKHFHVLFLFYLFLIVSFSICLIIGIRIQKPLSNVCRFPGSRIWTTRIDHHRWRLQLSKWKNEQDALSLK